MHAVHAQRIGSEFVMIFADRELYRVSVTALLRASLPGAHKWTTGDELPTWARISLISYGLSRQHVATKAMDTVLAARAEDVLKDVLERAVKRSDAAAELQAKRALEDWAKAWRGFQNKLEAA